MGRRLLIVAAVSALATAGALAAESDYLIVAGAPQEEQRLGPYRFGLAPGYAAAVRAFGSPGASSAGPSSCVVRWPKLGLSITFATAPPNACAASVLADGRWAGTTIRSGPWRTAAGLRLGDALATLRRLYPKARRADRSSRWLLVYRRGEVGVTVYLEADIRSGRVAAFLLPLPLLSVG